MKKGKKNPCSGCVWAKGVCGGIIFCPFPKCVKGKLPDGKERGRPSGREAD